MDLISREAEIEERKEESAQNVSKEDLISRKAAIDALQELPAAVHDFVPCADCRYADGQIADGRYWCDLHGTFMRYCSDAERRQ